MQIGKIEKSLQKQKKEAGLVDHTEAETTKARSWNVMTEGWLLATGHGSSQEEQDYKKKPPTLVFVGLLSQKLDD